MSDTRTDRPRLTLAMIAFAVLGLGIPVVAIVVAYKSCMGTTVRGAIAVTGGGVEWKARLGGCAAEADGRTAALDAGGEPVLRATLDPIDGARLEVLVPGQPPIVVTPATCAALVVAQRTAGKRDDGSAILDGSFAVACAVPAGHPLAGARVDGDGWWNSCQLAR